MFGVVLAHDICTVIYHGDNCILGNESLNGKVITAVTSFP